MITKMKKLTFLVYHKEYEAFLNGVRDLGVVHVAEKQQGVADNTELQDSIRLSGRLQAAEKLWTSCKLKRINCNSNCKLTRKKKLRWNLGAILNLQVCRVCAMPD